MSNTIFFYRTHPSRWVLWLVLFPGLQVLENTSFSESTKSNSIILPTFQMGKGIPTDEEIAKLPKDGGPLYNRLIFESSPYLLQHARNPINWRSWSEETLAQAIAEDKPIFLSIGYTTCHWCHVMENESFEDNEVAHILNEHYICIKVDREERPDLDHVYMSITQMMTGRGGWPMTVIMTPNQVPFFAGTYFPKSSMLDLLPHFSKVWKEERGKVNEIGRAIIENLAKQQTEQSGGDLNSSHLERCFTSLSHHYDPIYGGFGEQPKFPTPHALSFLLRYHYRTMDSKALTMATHTLKKIRLSGTYDQIGWGIHRYSTDQEWLVPHFEKMLYDQALFSIACLEAYQVTNDHFFRESCENTLAYVERNLSSPEGGFYSAEDADSEGEEGKFYLWKQEEIITVLGDQDGELFMDVFGFKNGGNYFDESTHKLTGKNIPNLSQSIFEYAQKACLEPRKFEEKIEQLRAKLFNARKSRIHPLLDDKVLTDWNGLMISAFAKSGATLNAEPLVQRAQKAAEFCLRELRTSDGRLLKRWRKGKAGLPAHLEDYAFLAQGLLDLYEATFKENYLINAQELIDLTIELFEDSTKGGFFLTAKDGEKLLARPKEIYDGAIPSGNSVMAVNLARLWKITGNETYKESLTRSFSAFSGFLEKNPSGAENFLHALALVLHPPFEIVISGSLHSHETQKFIQEINQRFLPFKTLLLLPQTSQPSEIKRVAPHLQNIQATAKTTFFLCRDYSCDHPIDNFKDLVQSLNTMSLGANVK